MGSRLILRKFALLLLMTVSIVSPSRPGTALESSSSLDSEMRDLYLSDVVVRGTIASVTRQMIRTTDFDPKSLLQGYYDVRFLAIDIDEVIRGSYSEPTIEVRINAGNSAMSYDYEAGLELVIGAVSQPNVMSGAFVGTTRYVKKERGWVNPGCIVSADSPTTDEIRGALHGQTLQELVGGAELVAVGTVEEMKTERIRESSSAREAFYDRIVLKPIEVLKGSKRAEYVFHSYSGGDYWPQGERLGPRRIEIGATYCVFLNSENGRWILSNGVDGLYYVAEGGEFHRTGFFAIQQRLPVSANKIAQWIREERE